MGYSYRHWEKTRVNWWIYQISDIKSEENYIGQIKSEFRSKKENKDRYIFLIKILFLFWYKYYILDDEKNQSNGKDISEK